MEPPPSDVAAARERLRLDYEVVNNSTPAACK
jgi:hypothetical protein